MMRVVRTGVCLASLLWLESGLAKPLHAAEPAAEAAENDPGAVSLFDGVTLEGWTGAVEGYAIEDGCLVSLSDSGGILYTERTFADFILKFEFRLTPGANNGIGVRVPAGGHPSRDGMEIQVLDNTHPRYRQLSPAQYHGSVYGIAPAKRGYLREVGEWNEQEVHCIGRRIKVILNGETIVDIDLDEALAQGAFDVEERPGALQSDGHLALCGHGSRVEFRRLRVWNVED